nr:hypothetical protein [Saprospiraceae bacterium]
MKAIKLKLFTACMALLFCALTASQVYGQTFTAIASGDWSSSATWVGEAPGTNESDVQIIIPVGIDVILDSEVTLSGNSTVLDVDGELNSAANSSLTMSGGSITGSGSIILEELVLEGTAIVVFTGTLTTDVLESAVATLTLVADVVVNQALVLSEGILNLDTGGSMNLESDAVVEVSGGSLALLGGTLTFSGDYNVIYSGNTSSETGIELSGEGLTDLTIDVGSDNTVTLNSNVDVAGTLSMESGTFELNGNDLEISGDVSATGNGELSASVAGSDLTVSSGGSVTGTLNFSSEANQVNNLNIEVGSSGSVAISGNLDVEEMLTLQSGVLALNKAELTINGDLTGSGSFSADAGSDLTLNVDGGTTAGLNFE